MRLAARLGAEHGGHLGPTAEVVAQDLERHLALDVDVLGLVDDAHAALAEPAHEPVTRAGDDAPADEAHAGALAARARRSLLRLEHGADGGVDRAGRRDRFGDVG
ncbi:hypothetical protein [Nannocystis pusilla]|uniref:hypothetical protein n=1 Tax=Nannocystis pusilla TaxID=889268 RepID=UPI003B77ACEB